MSPSYHWDCSTCCFSGPARHGSRAFEDARSQGNLTVPSTLSVTAHKLVHCHHAASLWAKGMKRWSQQILAIRRFSLECFKLSSEYCSAIVGLVNRWHCVWLLVLLVPKFHHKARNGTLAVCLGMWHIQCTCVWFRVSSVIQLFYC